MSEVDLLGVRVDVIDETGLHNAITRCVNHGSREVFAYVNIHAINIAQERPLFKWFLNRCSIVYCDGEGVRLGAQMLGVNLPPRVVLTYWIWELSRFCEEQNYSVFFLGSEDEYLRKAVGRIAERFPRLRIVGFHHGFFKKNGEESRRVIETINAASPDLLVVGFGMPLQEQWINCNLNSLNVRVVLPAGSVIEYASGHKGLAPSWMANHGFEWLYRLLQEPGRLWKRYLIGNPLFLMRVFGQRMKRGKQFV